MDFLAAQGFRPVSRSSNLLRYRSPFRNEKEPSFFVDIKKNTFRDYGSGDSGDIFALVQALNKCSFKEAINLLKNGSVIITSHEYKEEINYKETQKVEIKGVFLTFFLWTILYA